MPLTGVRQSSFAKFLFKRGGTLPPHAWRAARRGTTAVVVALFPFLFILDERVAFSLSPVLPGLLFLAILIIFLPFAWMSLWVVRNRRNSPELKTKHAARLDQLTNLGRVLAFVWFIAWLALGA